MGQKILIDADPGIGDAVAIAIALCDPDLDVVAVTATAGCVDGAVATRNAQAVIEELDPAKWPRLGGSPSVLLSRAGLFLRFESPDPAALAKAMVLVGDVLEQTPDSAAAHLLLSRLLVAGPNPDFDRAAEHLQRALRFSAARAKRDFSLFASWHSDRESSDRYLRLIPRLGVAAASEALALLEPLLCVSPAGWLAVAEQWVKLGSRTNDYGHYERAAALVEELPADSGEEWAIASGQLRGWIAFARGDLSLAESYLRGVLSKEPRNLVALNNLAYVLSQQGDRIEEAVAISRRAVDLAPDFPEYLDTYLQALMGAGRLGEAERAVRQALTRRSDCPRLRLMLAKILLARSRFEDARGELMEAASSQEARPPQEECRGDVEALWEELLQARVTVSPGPAGGERGHVAPR